MPCVRCPRVKERSKGVTGLYRLCFQYKALPPLRIKFEYYEEPKMLERFSQKTAPPKAPDPPAAAPRRRRASSQPPLPAHLRTGTPVNGSTPQSARCNGRGSGHRRSNSTGRASSASPGSGDRSKGLTSDTEHSYNNSTESIMAKIRARREAGEGQPSAARPARSRPPDARSRTPGAEGREARVDAKRPASVRSSSAPSPQAPPRARGERGGAGHSRLHSSFTGSTVSSAGKAVLRYCSPYDPGHGMGRLSPGFGRVSPGAGKVSPGAPLVSPGVEGVSPDIVARPRSNSVPVTFTTHNPLDSLLRPPPPETSQFLSSMQDSGQLVFTAHNPYHASLQQPTEFQVADQDLQMTSQPSTAQKEDTFPVAANPANGATGAPPPSPAPPPPPLLPPTHLLPPSMLFLEEAGYYTSSLGVQISPHFHLSLFRSTSHFPLPVCVEPVLSVGKMPGVGMDVQCWLLKGCWVWERKNFVERRLRVARVLGAEGVWCVGRELGVEGVLSVVRVQGVEYRPNPKDLKKYSIPGTGCCCPRKKNAEKLLIFGVMRYAKMGSAKKIAKMKYFLPLPPFLQEWQNRGRDALFAPLLVPPPLPSVSHAPFCTLLCFQRMMNQGPCIRASRIATILDISIRMLMCPKVDKGASSGHLIASPFVIRILLLAVDIKE